MFNFNQKEKGCNLKIKVGDKIYPVEGTTLHEHGNAHSDEGFCNAVRVAYANGKMQKGTFYAKSFILIESPK
mgnify:CR=1 FL=1